MNFRGSRPQGQDGILPADWQSTCPEPPRSAKSPKPPQNVSYLMLLRLDIKVTWSINWYFTVKILAGTPLKLTNL